MSQIFRSFACPTKYVRVYSWLIVFLSIFAISAPGVRSCIFFSAVLLPAYTDWLFAVFMPLLHTWTIRFGSPPAGPSRSLPNNNGCPVWWISLPLHREHRYVRIRDQPSRLKRWQFPYLPIEWFILFYYKVLLFLLIGIFILLYNDRYSMDLCSLTPSPVLRPSLSGLGAWRAWTDARTDSLAQREQQRRDWGYMIPIMA